MVFKAISADLLRDLHQDFFSSLWFLWDTTAHWHELFYKIWTQKLEPVQSSNEKLKYLKSQLT